MPAAVILDTTRVRRLRDALVARGADARPGTDSGAAASRVARARVAPFVETMYLMMMVDGETDADEEAAIRGALHMLTRGLLTDADCAELLDDCARHLEQQGFEGRLQTIGARLGGDRLDRETAFSLAAAIALADHTVDLHEAALMLTIGEWFGISERRSRELLAAT